MEIIECKGSLKINLDRYDLVIYYGYNDNSGMRKGQ